jgi:hypothetical protein
LVLTIVGEAYTRFTSPQHYSEGQALLIGLGILLVSPILIAWTRALWNTLVPRITGWREITFWEAAGVSAMVAFLAGR